MAINKVADAQTPNETQTLKDGPQISTAWKGHFSRSEINEYLLPGEDKTSTLLRIWGPAEGGARIKMDDVGAIGIFCGRHDKEYGSGSGRLNISSAGGLWKNEGGLHIVCNADADDPDAKAEKNAKGEARTDKDGLNVNVISGNYTEVTGEQRYIEALTVHIKATDQLILEGESGVKIISGGDIVVGGAEKTEIVENEMDIIFGQKMATSKESTEMSYDPRSTTSIVTPGHLNQKVLGDYKLWVMGRQQNWIAGKDAPTPFIKGKPPAFDVKSFLDGVRIQAEKGIEMSTKQDGISFEATKGDVDILAKDGKMTLESKDDMSLESENGDLSLTAKVKAILTGGDIEIDATSGDVDIDSSGTIRLN